MLGVIFGKNNKVKKANREHFFSAITAAVSLEGRTDLHPTRYAGIVFRPVESSFFSNLEKELKDLLKVSENATGTRFEVKDDGHGTRWVVLDDKDFEDLVSTLHLVAETIVEHGFGDRLLASVLRFDFEGRKAYWIYSMKRGKFYPFVLDGDNKRDNAAEMRLGALMEKEKIPMEKALESWYALWGIPF
ncbi:MAG: hypothetical protein FJ319_06550 [SAR202 cluster bacterium]|nr:hypothetical protein [SAR202 cluster bacterium]